MTKAFALNFSMKALFFTGTPPQKRSCLNLLDSLYFLVEYSGIHSLNS